MEKNTFPNIPNEINYSQENDLVLFWNNSKGKPVVLDVGCGHGDYLIENTGKYPNRYFIGIEISRKRAYKTSERLYKRGILNYSVVDCDAELALKFLFKENSIDEIHINFPDPWIRKRQWKNRVFKPSFLINAVRVLKEGGTLNFVTDVREYAEHVFSIIKDFPFLKNNYKKSIEENIYPEFPTLFYKKIDPLRGINYISFRKTSLDRLQS